MDMLVLRRKSEPTSLKSEAVYFDKYYWALGDRPFSPLLINKVFRLVEQERKDLTCVRVLDLGCGLGAWAKEFKVRGAEVIGVDLSTNVISEACKRNKDIKFVVANASECVFQKNSFELVFCGYLLHHLGEEDMFKSLLSMNKVLKPGGILFSLDPNAFSPLVSILAAVIKFKAVARLFGFHGLQSPDERPLKPSFLERCYRKAEFTEIKKMTFSWLPSRTLDKYKLSRNKLIVILDTFLDRLLGKIPLIRNLGANMFFICKK